MPEPSEPAPALAFELYRVGYREGFRDGYGAADYGHDMRDNQASGQADDEGKADAKGADADENKGKGNDKPARDEKDERDAKNGGKPPL